MTFFGTPFLCFGIFYICNYIFDDVVSFFALFLCYASCCLFTYLLPNTQLGLDAKKKKRKRNKTKDNNRSMSLKSIHDS